MSGLIAHGNPTIFEKVHAEEDTKKSCEIKKVSQVCFKEKKMLQLAPTNKYCITPQPGYGVKGKPPIQLKFRWLRIEDCSTRGTASCGTELLRDNCCGIMKAGLWLVVNVFCVCFAWCQHQNIYVG